MSAGSQTNNGSLPLAQIDVTDQRAMRRLLLRVEHFESIFESLGMFLRAEPDFDLRIVIGQLSANIANVHHVNFANALRESGEVPIALQLHKLCDALAILLARSLRIVFV